MFNLHYLISAGVILLALIADRFYLRRGEVKIIQATQCEINRKRFALRFSVKHNLRNCYLTYTIRDKEHPTTVYAGRSRTLDFSRVGINDEFISFDDCNFPPNSDWQLDIQISSCTGSYINPLYKIFPLITRFKSEVHFV